MNNDLMIKPKMVGCLIAQIFNLWFNNFNMSSEKLANIKTLKIETINIYKKNTPEKISTRVDINSLLIKLREKEKLQKQENLLFLGIISSTIITIGIIATL